MNQLTAEAPIQSGAERLQNLYASMIGTAATAAWDEIDEIWGQLGAVTVRQGDVQGVLRPDNIKFELGSLPGFAVHVGLETAQGPRQIQLGLNGNVPKFRMEPIEEEEDNSWLSRIGRIVRGRLLGKVLKGVQI